MQSKRRTVICAILLITIIVDQVTKMIVREVLRGHPPHIYLSDFFRFQYAENPGAFLSFGAQLGDSMRFWVSVVIAGFLTWLLVGVYRKRDMDWPNTLSLTLLVAGGYANLIDRFARGRVIDFMNLGIGTIVRTGIFNVADMAIVAAVAILVVSSFTERRH